MAPSRARARFQEDLKAAAERDIANVSSINKGDAENEFVFLFSHPLLPPPSQVEIRIQPQEIGSYPNENAFLAYTNGDVPASIAQELEQSMYKTTGMRVEAMLHDLVRRLQATLEGNKVETEVDSAMTDADASDFDEDETYDSDDDLTFTYGDDDDFDLGDRSIDRTSLQAGNSLPSSVLGRVRRDLRAVLDGGFRAGKICGLRHTGDHSIISTSIRVSKLCLSEETREAWNFASSDYIVLLIQYEGSYTDFEDAIERAVGLSQIRFRLIKCSEMKPSLQQAIAAFSSDSVRKSSSLQTPTAHPDNRAPEDSALSRFWVGESINNLMNDEFIPMLKIRRRFGVSWDSAKEMHSKYVKSVASASSMSDEDWTKGEKETPGDGAQLPPFLAVDHLVSNGEISLPLVATQFALRYLVRCSSYCMICHQKVKGNFEALKPYVCGDSLCLFQYMNLGLGPSIDHEIIGQPYVVDLLISFCYVSLFPTARTGNASIREFPKGLSLQVPNIRLTNHLSSRSVAINGGVLIDPIDILFDWDASTATIVGDYDDRDLREGRWIVLSTAQPVTNPPDSTDEAPNVVLHHARVEWKSNGLLQLRIASRHTMPSRVEANAELLRPSDSTSSIPGHLVLCNQVLDELTDQEKAFSMQLLICSLPSVMDMRSHLMSSQSEQLVKWDRLTPAAMGLLRWIVASNRSYIVQVDECLDSDGSPVDSNLGRKHERISGVDGWMQFRFAQGSPEKEALFSEALEHVNKPQRTLLAWHGSTLANWHSIIRQGLDYAVAANGRAFGDGVYFSRDFDYSLIYTQSVSWSGNGPYRSMVWPQSALKIDAAISLNELVNRPKDFRNSSTCFVVQHCHWIQCRYIFVRPRLGGMTGNVKKGKDPEAKGAEFIQDPQWKTTGPARGQLFIPKIAIPSAQRGRKVSIVSLDEAAGEHQMDSSDDDEDMRFIFPEEYDTLETSTTETPQSNNSKPCPVRGLPPTPTQQEPRTDFRPGTLDFSSLPQLAPPSYATEAAQKTIGREIKKLQQVQSSTPLHELGWYIDFERMNNMFQWIVELHSFDSDLPLARDMKTAGLTSIVLEIRFLREFPMSPPFVRVVRPRFLPFMSGGGGHITSGGAMCMELLTNSGWSPVSSLESVLLQVRMAISSTDPTPARLENARHNGSREYGVREAVEAYTRAATAHGWKVPNDMYEATVQMLDGRTSA
ncbi:hypothetical protein F4779DRAFT_440507 [Xylariaceae sp. FL0662B]|nr:hypothetical protein F4779DRAFT_440507 [Xylariaceae sp. FL0662B]